jgi:hypothetical protein
MALRILDQVKLGPLGRKGLTLAFQELNLMENLSLFKFRLTGIGYSHPVFFIWVVSGN